MDTQIQKFNETARKLLGLSDLEMSVFSEVHSGVTDHRTQLRAHLKQALEAKFPHGSDFSSVLTPGNRTPVSGVFFSVSHSPVASGFAFSSTPIGLDLEDATRIRTALSERVRSKNDLPRAVSSPCFWSAKESAFKALPMDQSSTLSQIAITSWDETSGHFLFEASTENTSGSGVVTKIQTLTISIFRKGASFSR